MAEQSLTRPGATTSENLLERLVELKKQAYSQLNRALSIDTANRDAKDASQADAAILAYETSLQLIQQALTFYTDNVQTLSNSEPARKLFSQLSEMQTQTVERTSTLRSQRASTASKDLNSNEQEEFITIGDDILNDCIIIDDVDSNNNNPGNSVYNNQIKDFERATELVRIDQGVQLFYIAADGTVSTPSYPTTLSVYSFENEQPGDMAGFVRVGEWVYPLIRNQSPAMKTNFNAYIFPNNNEESTRIDGQVNNFVGITFSNHVSQEERMLFEDVLNSFDSLIFQEKLANEAAKSKQLEAQSQKPLVPSFNKERENVNLGELKNKELVIIDEEDRQPAVPQPSNLTTSEYISQSLLSGAKYISGGLSKTTEVANQYLKSGGEKLKSQLTPNEQPVVVDPKLKKTVEAVRYGSHVSVRVSNYLVDKLGVIATAAARKVGPTLREGTTSLLSKTGVVGNKENASGYVEGFCNVAGSSIKSAAIVYHSLEQAGFTLAKNMTDETVNVVNHK